MTRSNDETRQPDYVAEKQSPNYVSAETRSKNTPQAEGAKNCHAVNPPGPPSSAAENHKDANQECDAGEPKTASKDEREKAVG